MKAVLKRQILGFPFVLNFRGLAFAFLGQIGSLLGCAVFAILFRTAGPLMFSELTFPVGVYWYLQLAKRAPYAPKVCLSLISTQVLLFAAILLELLVDLGLWFLNSYHDIASATAFTLSFIWASILLSTVHEGADGCSEGA